MENREPTSKKTKLNTDNEISPDSYESYPSTIQFNNNQYVSPTSFQSNNQQLSNDDINSDDEYNNQDSKKGIVINQSTSPIGVRSEYDSDYHFLMSLHPFMIKMDPLSKLDIRSKICSVLSSQLRVGQNFE